MPQKPQTFANHTRLDPPFHFFVLPVFSAALITAIVDCIAHPSVHSAAFVILALAAAAAVLRFRMYALKVQDRVIRLEERLRLAALLPEALKPRIPELTERQLIALRFASDPELPKLAERAWSEKLPPKEIKKAIQSWRPDYWRV